MKRKQIIWMICALVLTLSLVAVLCREVENALPNQFENDDSAPTAATTATPQEEVPTAVTWVEKIAEAQSQTYGNLVLVDSAYESDFVTYRTVPMRAEHAAYALQAEACAMLEKMMEAYIGYPLSVLFAKSAPNVGADAICHAGAFSSGLDVCFVGKDGAEMLDFYRIGSGKNWLYRNCVQYGFVPCQESATDWRAGWFRYVGTPHALLMKENALSLGDYLARVRTDHRTYENAWTSTQYGKEFRVFYCPVGADGKYHFFVPSNAQYILSGDNRGGVFVCAFLP